MDEHVAAQLDALLAGPQRTRIVAVGETGLDYNRNFSTPAAQKGAFRTQLALACKHDLPLFCHERDAHEDFMAIVQEYPTLPPLVVHCFTGTQAELRAYIACGFFIGVTGFLCMKRRGEQLRACLAQEVPLERLMVETDGPFMTPDAVVKARGRRNMPSNLAVVVQQVAELYCMDVEHVARVLLNTTRSFFRLSKP